MLEEYFSIMWIVLNKKSINNNDNNENNNNNNNDNDNNYRK